MNRKIAALALGVAAVLIGACGNKSEPEAAPTTDPAGQTSPSYKPEDFELVDVPVSKPAPGVVVDAATLPEELSSFTSVPGLTPEQQTCINGAIKGSVDADPSLAKTPGKVASLGGKAVTVCDGQAIITNPLLEQLSGSDAEAKVKLTADQATCFKDAFAADKDNTAKVVSGMMSLNPGAMQTSLAPFETKCGVKLSEAFTS